MAKKKRDKNENIIVIFIVVSVILGILVSAEAIRRTIIDPREKAATSDMHPWNFVIIGDTQAAKEYIFYDTYFNRIVKERPDMMFHVGDFNWSLPTDNPLKGILNVQYWRYNDADPNNDYPVEIHVAPGNHDDGCGSTLYPHYINGICYGKHTTGVAGKCEHTSWSDNLPFNPEVKNVPGYCDFDSQDHSYIFERGNIRFIVAERIFVDTTGAKAEWFKQQVCADNSASVTIAYNHENEFTNFEQLIDSLPCGSDHNLKAIFMGHGHRYQYEEYKGVNLLAVSGMVYCALTEGDEAHGCDIIKIDVNSDQLKVKRIQYNDGTVYSEKEIFSVGGIFSDYEHPDYPKDSGDDGDSDDGDGTGDDGDDDGGSDTQSFEVSLKSGSQLVSFPFTLENQRVSDLAGNIVDSLSGDKDITVSMFRSGRWVSYQVKKGTVFADEDFEVSPGVGYLMGVKKGTNLEVEGSELTGSTKIKFKKGWNLVGIPGGESSDLTAKSLIAKMEDDGINVKMVTYLDSGRYWSLIIEDGQEYGHDFPIGDEIGYFVFVNSPEEKEWGF